MSQQSPPPGNINDGTDNGTDNLTEPLPPYGDGQTPPGPGGATPGTPSDNRFFAWMRGLDVPRQPGWIGGVCAGIAARLGIDPLIVRGIVVVVAVLGGPALLLYAAAWLLLPDYKDRIHLEEVFRGKFDGPVIGVGVVFLVAILPIGQGFWFFGSDYWGAPGWVDAAGSTLWTLIVVGLIIAFVVWLARRASRSTPPTMPGTAGTAGAGDTTSHPNAATVPFPTTPLPYSDGPLPSATAPLPGMPLDAGAPPLAFTAPPPGVGAPPEDVAAWRERQAQWKAQHDAYRQQQAGQKQAANRATQERARAERIARYNADRAQRLRTRSHPLYSFVVIGLALIAGALATLLTAGITVEYQDVMLGLATALAVLAVGIVVNGVRGKRSGGASGFASVIVAALIVTAAIPHGPQFQYGFDTEFTPTYTADSDRDTFIAGVGDVTFDLTDYYNDSREGDAAATTASLLLLAGAADVTVILPDDEFVQLTTQVGAGSVVTRDSFGSTDTLFSNSVTEYLPSGEDDWDGRARQLYVEVQLGAGTITVIDPTEGASE